MKGYFCIAVAMLLALLSAPCFAQTKIAVINSREVLTKCDLGVQALKDIDAKFADRKKMMAATQQELRTLQEEVKSAGEKSPKFKEFQTMLNKFREDDQKFRQDVSQDEAQKIKPIAEKVNKILADYAKEKGLQGIQEKSTYVYLDPAMDVTDEIIKRVNQEK
jgi:outer membrane protein